MKKFLLILVLCSAVILPQTLREVVKGTYKSFSAVDFVDDNTGWISGASERIYKTTDGGNSWTMQYENTATSNSFNTIQFLNANTGFAGGGTSSGAKLLKTENGGANWIEMTAPDTMLIKKLYFTDANNGWLLTVKGNTAHVVKTSDGGTSWSIVLTHTTSAMEDLFVLPSGRGLICGGGAGKLDIYYTADGTTWTKAPAPSLGGFTYTRTDIRGVYLVNDNIGYACGYGTASAGLQPSILLKTTDGGATWTYLTQLPENRTYVNLNALVFTDELHGMAVGGAVYEGTVVVRTTDGGTNWIPYPSGTGFTVQDACNIGNKVWSVGASGCISYSENFGDSWQLKTPVVSSTINDLFVVNNTVYAAGYAGFIVKSTDKGVTWSSGFAATDKVCPSINSLHFLNESTGFAARNNRLVSKTTDGGDSWTKILSDTNSNFMSLQGIHFFDENTGFAAGRVASNVDAVYKTTDGGSNWSLTTNIAQEELNDICFADANIGAAAGKDSKMLYTTDGGSNWQTATLLNVPGEVDIFKIDFSANNKGIAVGQSCIFTTDNGGATWQYITVPGLTVDVNGIALKDENEGWAVGDDGLILHTMDAGKTWENVSDTLITGSGDIYAAAVDGSGDLWIAMGESTIYTTSPFVSVNDNTPVPLNFVLDQNYPNPFNPATTISYSVASESKVTLRIYDVLGKLVEELVNENLPAGKYTINYNASSLSTGIYFCVMNAGGNVLTRKMTLIK